MNSKNIVMKRAVIYARFSSDSQRDESIEDQLRECHDYANRNGYEIVGEYTDRALTGRSDRRPDFLKMIKDSESSFFDYVICYKTDRFARSRNDASKYKNILKNNGVRVVYSKVDIPKGPEGIILEGVLEALDEYYSANLSQNIRRGQTGNALKCMSNGVDTFGWDRDSNDMYVINEFEAYAVREVFDMVLDGFHDGEIIDWLNSHGYRNKKGREFTKNAVARMIRNRKYMGEYSFADVVVPGGMPVIIPEDKFLRANEVYKMKKVKRVINNDFILTKVLFCGECGESMQGTHGTSHTGKKHYYYSCYNRKRKKGCHKSNINKDWIENEFIRILNTYVFNDDVLNDIADGVMKYQEECIDNSNLQYLESQLVDTQKSLDNIVSAVEKGLFNDSMIGRMNELERRKKELVAKISLEKQEHEVIEKDFILFLLKKFKTTEQSSIENKRRLIETFVSKAFIFDDGRLVLTFNYKKNGHLATFEEIINGPNAVRKIPIGGGAGHQSELIKVEITSNNLFFYLNLIPH